MNQTASKLNHPHNLRKVAGRFVLPLILVLIQSMPCHAQETSVSGPENPAPCQQRPIDTQELEGFIDQFFEKALQEDHIPGAVFVFVKDGKIVVNKGYGYADLEQKFTVDPQETMFRTASISKLFTAMAIMQLVEEGKIELDEDVNKYLNHFQIKTSYDRPITVKDLLTHTDGFDLQWYIGWFARSEKEMKPLSQYLADRLPPQIESPGHSYYYSDVGMTLAGYIVEQLAGVDFVQYIDERYSNHLI